jgi:ABC-2 type transport system ATP-binding protein
MMLRFDTVKKSYGSIHALAGLSFGVERNEIVAVLGPNGAGKTTALEIAVGLRSPDSGSVSLFGGSPRDLAMRRRLGVTPQESGFPDALTVCELLAFAVAHYDRPAGIDETLARFGLEALASRRAGALSGGESRRLAVALAFAGNPELVVLDEPTTGLDVESRRRLWSVVRESARDRSVLFTTHYLEEAEALATRILVIDHGRLLFDGNVDAIRARFGVRRIAYVGDPLDGATLGFEASFARENGRVVVTTAQTDQYVRALVEGGVTFSELEIVRPSLEEAFLAMTGGER